MRNQSGQAAIEYVLMVVVTVSLMFMLKGVFTGAETFMYKYVGEYTACLMEYGELPSFNVADSDLKNHTGGGGGKVCNSKFDGFTVGNGWQESGSGSGGSGSTTKTSSTSNAASTSSSKNSSQSASTSSKSSSSVSSSSSGKNGGSSSPYSSGKISRSSGGRNVSTADGPSSGSDDKVKVTGVDEGQDGRRRGDMDFYTSSRSTGSRDRYKAITGVQADEISKRAKVSVRAPSSKIVSVAEEEGRIGPRKSTIEPYERKPNFVGPQDDDSFTFGSFMKWLIIAAMFIAIFLFFGGQVMNFMNSQEK
ncbi:MAG: hypothetical protein H7256_05765 [Bdellovibrio sp.]|nr:hypothetical protein [Bdellovibrio sp.]